MRSSPEQAMGRSDRKLTGRIFDIQRFSINDGRGIRTTVFLKGCPLRCAWCQNPEGIAPERTVVHLRSECIGCRRCVALSKNGGAVIDGDKVRIVAEALEDFDVLMYECPADAIRWNGSDMSVEDVMAAVERDRPFYAHGGGMTLSGGDPLLQIDFAKALLEAAKEKGIHTAVETEMHAPLETVQTAARCADVLYADLKLMDRKLSKQYTGTDGVRIRCNIRRVLTGPYRDKVIVRTPLVPGITATRSNIACAARFLSGLKPDVEYELLNYNTLAPAKYPLAGRSYPLGRLTPLPGTQLEELADAARSEGLLRVRIVS